MFLFLLRPRLRSDSDRPNSDIRIYSESFRLKIFEKTPFLINVLTHVRIRFEIEVTQSCISHNYYDLVITSH